MVLTVDGHPDDASDDGTSLRVDYLDVEIEHLLLMNIFERAGLIQAHRRAVVAAQHAPVSRRAIRGEDDRIGSLLEPLQQVGARAGGLDEAVVALLERRTG